MTERLPHPLTGQLFASPVPAGQGWPEDPASRSTPVACSAEDVTRLADRARTLAELDARVTKCRACPRLVDWRESVAKGKRASFAGEPYWGRPVASLGDPEAWLGIIGLAPAAHGGNRTGRMFTGDRSGDWIHAALYRAGMNSQPDSKVAGDGLVMTGARTIAPVHCAPPDNKPTPDERHACAGWLRRELQLIPTLEILIALGGIAWQATLSGVRAMGWDVPRPQPRFGHGAEAVLTRADGVPVRLVGSYHPSQQNTFTGRLTTEMLDAVFARAKEIHQVNTGETPRPDS
ncbi:uracil-DNA glycosylase [Brevibacterium luteolum]|uniref:uracil-DNA glycosylase n=1 Tax=Brevibacterium luteolum TaxID=199591 RepID=UPI00387A560F